MFAACSREYARAQRHGLPRMPYLARARRSRRLRAMLAAAPVLLARTVGPFRMEKIYQIVSAVHVMCRSLKRTKAPQFAKVIPTLAHIVIRAKVWHTRGVPLWRAGMPRLAGAEAFVASPSRSRMHLFKETQGNYHMIHVSNYQHT